uniref:Acyl-CoA desaturase 1-like n=1 Tax=Dermatophagoides pteronyssinus TaxID=6956 RepID=A0A6P6XQX2_DERPT|nr:acyl-CoA desaturase 1-like [Dermatophagoides pteronyssinus]
MPSSTASSITIPNGGQLATDLNNNNKNELNSNVKNVKISIDSTTNDNNHHYDDNEDNKQIDKNIEQYCSIPGEPKETIELDQSIANIINQQNDLNEKIITMKEYPPCPGKLDYIPGPKRIAKNRWEKFWHTTCRLKWNNIFYLSALHITCIFACYHAAVYPVKFWTAASAITLGYLTGMGMSVGAHRYWAHRSFKAKPILRLGLMLLQTMTMNGTIFSYARDHRNHHKYSDTEADPKNPAKGLFHAHVGWWLWKKSPVVIAMGKKFDVSDLWNDPLIRFQHRFYVPLFIVLNIILPTIVPWILWNENLLTAFYVIVIIRTTVVLHLLFCVNSVAHHYGYRPYDFRIRPADNRIINYLSMGEGNHNYHHVFPYDYRSNEKEYWEYFDPISHFIHITQIIGLTYDCKKASPRVVMGIVRRKGIPAYFDHPRSLTFRILNACFDWVAGSIVTLWFLYPFLIYKYFTDREIFIYRWET